MTTHRPGKRFQQSPPCPFVSIERRDGPTGRSRLRSLFNISVLLVVVAFISLASSANASAAALPLDPPLARSDVPEPGPAANLGALAFPDEVFAPLPVKKGVAVPVPAPAAFAVAFAAAAPDANLDPLIQQFLPQFRQMMNVEAHFVKTVCALSKDQCKTLDRQSLEAAKAAAKKYAGYQQKMMQGQWVESQPVEPRQIVDDALGSILKSCLTAKQCDLYRAEIDHRKEDKKQVTIRNLVARLDEELVLSAEQRQKLSESLSKNWKEVWAQSLEMIQNNNNIFPNVPDQHVGPLLNKTQRVIWQGIQKGDLNYWGGFGLGVMFDGDGDLVEIDAVDDLEEAAAAVVAPAPVPAAKEVKKK